MPKSIRVDVPTERKVEDYRSPRDILYGLFMKIQGKYKYDAGKTLKTIESVVSTFHRKSKQTIEAFLEDRLSPELTNEIIERAVDALTKQSISQEQAIGITTDILRTLKDAKTGIASNLIISYLWHQDNFVG